MYGKVNVSSGSRAKFVNVTCGAVFPDNPQQYDIFLEDSTLTMKQIYFEGEVNITNTGDVSVVISNRVEVPKVSLHKDNKNMNLTVVAPPSTMKIFESDYLTVYAKYGFVKTVLQDGTKKNVRAHYYNGTTWIKFSDSVISHLDRVAFLYNGVLTVLDITTGQPAWQVTTGHTSFDSRKISYNFLDGMIGILTNYTTWQIYNAESGQLLKSGTLPYSAYSNLLYIPEKNKFYFAWHKSSTIEEIVSLDMQGNVEVIATKTVVTGFTSNTLSYDPYTRCFLMGAQNTTNKHFLPLDAQSGALPSNINLHSFSDEDSAALFLPFEQFGATRIMQLYGSGGTNWSYGLTNADDVTATPTSIGSFTASYAYWGAIAYSAKSKKIYMTTNSAGSNAPLTIHDPFAKTSVAVPNVGAVHIEPLSDGNLLVLRPNNIFRKIDSAGALLFEVTSSVSTGYYFIPIGIPGKVYPLLL